MFKDIKKGFSFSVGRLLSRVLFFGIIFVIFLLVGSCKAHAETVPITDFYDNRNEFYNKTLWSNVNGIDYYRFTNTGQVTAIFNNYDSVNANNNNWRYGVEHLFTSISFNNNPINTNSSIHFYLYFSGIYIYPTETFTGTLDAYDSDTWPGYMNLGHVLANINVNYLGTSNGTVPANCSNANSQLTPNAVGFECYANIPSGYNINWLVIDFPVRIYHSLFFPTYYLFGIGHGVSTTIDIERDIDLSSDINNQTTQIINNQNNNTKIISSKIDTTHGILNTISSAISNVINALSNLPSLIFNSFSNVLNNILNAFGTLWNNISSVLLDVIDIITDGFDTIFSNDEPTSQYISDLYSDFILSHNNTVLEFVTLPIYFLTNFMASTTCNSFNLGALFNTNLVLPCLRSTIISILGTNLYNVISGMITVFIYWRLLTFLYEVIQRVLTLSTDINNMFNINL